MPSLPVHLEVLGRIAAEPRALPLALRRALSDDLEYARFGAALPDLPWYAGAQGILRATTRPEEDAPPWAQVFSGDGAVGFGLSLCELVGMGSLVGQGAGTAVVTGYFVHLALERAMAPLTRVLVSRLQRPGEPPRVAWRRIEWEQAVLNLRETRGHDPLGTSEMSDLFRIVKRRGPPLSGVGRGLYELVRAAARTTWGIAPEKNEVDGWLRGLYLHGKYLATPFGRRAAPKDAGALARRVYRGPSVDFPAALADAEAQARALLVDVGGFLARLDFSPNARGQFLTVVPEGPLRAGA